MNPVQSYEQFINEAKLQVKQKYTDKHPAKTVSSYAPIRERILAFVKENSPVSHKEISEFLKFVNEETGGNTNTSWLVKNKHYFKVSEKDDTKTYSLSPLGERVYGAMQELNKD